MVTNRRYKEVLGISLILFSIIVLLSLLSFNINDFELLTRNRTVSNKMGPIGAYLSNFMRSAFGYSSYFVFVIFVVSGWSILKKVRGTEIIERIFSLFYLMISSCMLISLLFNSYSPHFSGGYIGLYLSRFIETFFSKLGAYVIISIMNLIGLILLGIVSMSFLLNYTDKKSGKLYNFIEGILKRKYFYLNRDIIPLNKIDKQIKKRRKRMPWIIKKRISVEANNDIRATDNRDFSKLLEIKNPVSLEIDISSQYDEDLSFQKEINEEGENVSYKPIPFVEGEFMENNIGHDVNINSQVPDDLSIRYDESLVNLEYNDENDDEEVIKVDIDDSIYNIERNRIRSVEFEDTIDSEEQSDEYKDLDSDQNYITESKINTYDVDDEIATLDGENIPRIFEKIVVNGDYYIPISFLQTSLPVDIEIWKCEVRKNSELLVNTLQDFSIESWVINVNRGPVITLYELQIAPGIKINRIVGLSDDITMALAAPRVRIVAPIPGKSAIGVEVPNKEREMVTMGDIIKLSEYQAGRGELKIALGKDILGKPIMLDLKKLPHLLIAGATGSGKSVCVNSIITSLIYNYDPNHVRFILVDPKMVELQLYNGLPHLLTPVITEVNAVPKVLKWAMYEMERRYRLLSELNTRDIVKYNLKIEGYSDHYERLPYILIIIDELADLMMIASKEIEGFIIRIAQKARAVGMHLVLATQRPSVDVITGVIKANFPARIAFQVAQKTDSRTIIDQNGAEKLLGKGDMLYQSPVNSFPIRIQGSFISEEEIIKIVQHLMKMGKTSYIDIEDEIYNGDGNETDENVGDELFIDALKIVEETKKASASYLQRRLSIGYNRAARIIELMEERGYIGPQQGSKPREVYV